VAVILKIKWRMILTIIWRMQPSQVGPSLGVSATFDQSCYLDNASALRVTGGVEFVDAIIPPHFRVRAFHSAPGTQVSSRDRDFRPTRRRVFDEDNFEIQYTT
jgi:hypothetical protein